MLCPQAVRRALAEHLKAESIRHHDGQRVWRCGPLCSLGDIRPPQSWKLQAGLHCSSSCLGRSGELHMKVTPRIGSAYWRSIIVGSVFGANVGDFLSDTLGLGHLNGLPVLAGCWSAFSSRNRSSPSAVPCSTGRRLSSSGRQPPTSAIACRTSASGSSGRSPARRCCWPSSWLEHPPGRGVRGAMVASEPTSCTGTSAPPPWRAHWAPSRPITPPMRSTWQCRRHTVETVCIFITAIGSLAGLR